MTAQRSSENNDGHQVRAPIGLAGVCALHRADQSGIMSRFPSGFHGLSEGLIDFEALVAAAAGTRHCPHRRPSRDRIRRLGGWPAIGVRAGRLRPGRTDHPAAGRAVPRSVGRGHPQKPQWCAEA